jgi:Xaa-Pro aminopeptidase
LLTDSQRLATADIPKLGRKPRPSQLCNLDRLVATMKARGIDGVVSYYMPNVFYLSGFIHSSAHMIDEMQGYAAVVISRRKPDDAIVIIPDFDLTYFAAQSTWISDVRPYRSLVTPADLPWDETALDRYLPTNLRELQFVVDARKHYAPSLGAAVLTAMKDLGLDRGRVGFDNPFLANVLGYEIANLERADGYSLIKAARQFKTPGELELLREAQLLNQAALEQTVGEWQPGMTWHELVLSYYVNVIKMGGFIHDRGSIIWSNPRGSDPAVVMSTGLEEDFVLEEGDCIMFDCHGKWLDYNYDGGKTWIIGETSRRGTRAERVAVACADSLQEMMNAMRPGTRAYDLMVIGREAFRKHGVGDADLILPIFHGVGIENSEKEFGGAGAYEWTVEEGMVMAAHILYPGGDKERHYIEDVGLVHPDGMQGFYTWGPEPLTN